MHAHQDLMNDFDWAAKTKQPACKTLRVWTKNEEHFESFQEKFEIFWSKSLWKIDFFSQFFTKYFLDFWLPSESTDLWKITPGFYNFSDFGGGERSGVPPPSRRYCSSSRSVPLWFPILSIYQHFSTFYYLPILFQKTICTLFHDRFIISL